jgi:uncharacterized membrane protein
MDPQACPIDASLANERVSRATALGSLLLLSIFYFTHSFWIIVCLMADFFLRAFGNRKISPLNALSAFILRKMKVPPQPVNAAPKTFAARIGFVFCFCIALCSAVNLYAFAALLTAMIAACTFLESVFGFCVGCKLHALLHSLAKKDAAGINGQEKQIK